MFIRRAALILLLVVVGCGAGGWLAMRQVLAPFLAPGASDVRVEAVGWGARLISYRMPNPDDAWLTTVARRLRGAGWVLSDEGYLWGNTERYTTIYTRSSRLWFLRLDERAELLGDRSFAQIEVSYRLTTE
jgi:hypothetical protein